MTVMMRYTAVALAIALLLCGDVKPAQAEGNKGGESSLRGKYAFASSQTCTYSSVGFEKTAVGYALLPAPLDTDRDRAPSLFNINQAIHGTRTFDGKGGWRQNAQTSTLNLAALPSAAPFLQYPVTNNVSVAEGNYTVGADGSVTVTNIVLHVNFTSGPRKDKCMQDNNGDPLLDQNGNPAPLSHSRCTVYGGSKTNSSWTLTFRSLPGQGLVLSDFTPEQVEIEDYDGIFPTLYRTCVRSSTNARLPDKGEDER
jgi:hypothetical protein